MNSKQHKQQQQASTLMQQGNLKQAEVLYGNLANAGVRDHEILCNPAVIVGIKGRTT